MAKRKSSTGAPDAVGTISSEIRQTRPFGSLEREMAVTLLRTGDVLHHAVDIALRPLGASQEQYNILRILRGAAEDGLKTLEIAQRMVSRSPNITRLLDKMVAKGLAERHAVEGDRRVVRITVTAAGLELLTELDVAIEAMLGRLSALPPADLKNLVRLLDVVRQRLIVPTAREEAALRKKKSPGKS